MRPLALVGNAVTCCYASLHIELRRVGEKGEAKFERIGWDEALDEVASRLKKIIEEHGATAILPYSYAGTEGIVQAKSLDRRFFAHLEATRLERNICGATAHAGLTATMGTSTGILPEDIQKSRFNARGAVEIAAEVDEGTLESVVNMPHGFWASLLPGGSSANALTPDGLADLGGGGSFYDARVDVEKLAG
jgi:anaerobic selenocysteine-containing dehydrogenase